MTSPFTARQARALTDVLALWPDAAVVLVGAGAIACHRPNTRGTDDLDLSVTVDRDDLARLDSLPDWHRSPRREHEWRVGEDVLVDVLPASKALLHAGRLEWPSGHVMSLIGLEHAFVHNIRVPVTDVVDLQVATLAVIVLLKMVAYLDRPADRERDLEDIAFIIEEYCEGDARRWADDIVSLQLAYEDVGAFLLGRDIAAFATARDQDRINTLLARFRDGHDLSRMARRGPPSWRRSEDVALARLASFERGLRGPQNT